MAMALIAATLLTAVDSRAQEIAEEVFAGEVIRTNWPDFVYESQGAMAKPGAQSAEDFSDLGLLPFLDTLSVSYAYELVDGLPYGSFDFSWVAGDTGVLDGIVRPLAELPPELRLTQITLLLSASHDGSPVADMILELDSLWLPPSPEQFEFETADSGWEGFFSDLSADSARAVFGAGFELSSLSVLQIGFSAEEQTETRERKEVLVVRRPPRSATVWTPNVDIWIGWTVGRDPYRVRPRAPRANRPRGDSIGRTTGSSERERPRSTAGSSTDEIDQRRPDGSKPSDASTGEETSRDDSRRNRARGLFGGKKAKEEDDDDDDDRDLLGPALAGVAAVGALAYFGGTAGLYGHSEAPIGLLAGRAGNRGGFLLQVAVNQDVITAGNNEALVAIGTFVLPPVGSKIHPTIGVGAWLDEISDEVDPVATVQLGALIRLDPMRVMAAWDSARGGISVGLAINLRSK